jgi:4-azaleucine resistance transporter AzlC
MCELRFAFRQTIPVMLGYIFLGIAFGLMLNDAGYHFVWAFFISVVVYAGSMQFVLVTLLSGGAALLYAAMMTFFINGRHIFYGLSLIEKYSQMGKSYPYMIFSLTDETYSLMCRTKVPEGLNEKRVMLLISLLDHSYWVLGSLLGGLAGALITFDSTGIEFSMTALFTAIVVEQWREKSNRLPILMGAGFTLLFLLVLGPDSYFILPALALSVGALLLKKGRGRLTTAPTTNEKEHHD